MNRKLLFFLPLFIFCGNFLIGQNSFFRTDTVQVIEITFPTPNWDYEMDTAKIGSDGYVLATQVKINGTIFDSVGVRYKGNSSYDSTVAKNPLHLKLDYVHGTAAYDSYTDVKLSNCFADPSMVREVLAYDILRNYMAAPQCNFARVTINGIYYGVYSNCESIDNNFLSNHFYSASNSFFKCNPVSVINGHFPNLLYLGTDSANYYDRYEMKSVLKWQDLINLCDTITNHGSSADSILDIDRALWMLAFNNETVNLDSYSGAFAQNYYLYKDGNGRFDPIVWDLNMCFGGFTNTGLSNLSLTGMQQMTPLLHSTNGARPMIMNLFANSTYLKMYIAHMRTIDTEFFSNGNYLAIAQSLQTLIDSSVQVETFSLFTYNQFQQGLTTTISNVPGISTLMSPRTAYLNSTTQFQQIPPFITNVHSSPTTLSLNDTIWITANVSNSASVMLGYRDQTPNRFYRIPMYDDGLHHDGAAGDFVFGANITATSAFMQYYIYAENANAGMFSPERAEYEFYSIPVAVTAANVGQVVINEFVASNQTGTTNEVGAHQDWIELYNRTSIPLSMYGLYLTDDYTLPMKYAFPEVVIPPYGYMIIWADLSTNTSSYLHCNFHLSAAGEQIMLSNSTGAVLDSISFGAQTTDISLGRCPNGTGPFIQFANTTFNSSNICPAGVHEQNATTYSVSSFPNPASNEVNIISNYPGITTVDLVNSEGQLLETTYFENDKALFDLKNLAPGIYFFRTKDKNGMILQMGKIALIR